MWAHYQHEQAGHNIKPIPVAIELAVNEKKQLLEEGKEVSSILETSISQYQQLQESMTKQKFLYLKKLDAEFDLILKLIEIRKQDITEKVTKSFDSVLSFNSRTIEGMVCSKQRISYLSKFRGFKDTDVIRTVKRLDDIFNTLTTVNFSFTDQHDLTESIFTCSPMLSINKALNVYDFVPINNLEIATWGKLFTESKILDKEMLTSEFVGLFPKVKDAKLLYQMSRDGAGTDKFHQKCTGKGPTVLLVKANGGYVFGGYNPYSWIKENAYLNTTNSFLFSETDGRGRKPIKFPTRPSRADAAIRWCESPWSPGFGEEGVSDLFIAFKNPKNSYSRLGIVYEVPDDMNQTEDLLAGRRDNWNVEDIEIFSFVSHSNLE